MNLTLASRGANLKTRINALFKLVPGHGHAVCGVLRENVPRRQDIDLQQAGVSLVLTDMGKL